MPSLEQRWTKAKPYVYTALGGLIAGPVIGLWSGLLVTSGAQADNLRLARIDTQAAICAQMAQAYRAETGDVTPLKGYDGRQAREALAARFALMPGEDSPDRQVLRACSRYLEDLAEA